MIDNFYAKGKRGIVKLEEQNGRKVIIKTHNPRSSTNTLYNESKFLKILNKHHIGPRLISSSKDQIIMEFIDGLTIEQFLQGEAKKRQMLNVLFQILDQCALMDDLHINKFEMTNPYKHIIIDAKYEAVMIDFERCRYSKKVKNVTQFCSYLIKDTVFQALTKRAILFDKENLLAIAKRYKDSIINKDKKSIFVFLKILKDELLGKTLRNKVFLKLLSVPKKKVTTYKDLALALNTKAYQAIGQVMRNNPYAPIIPCHLVVKIDGSLGGFMGKTTGKPILKKKRLLQEQGIPVEKGKIKNFEEKHYTF